MSPTVQPPLRYVIEDVRLFDGENCFPQPYTVHFSGGLITYVGIYEKEKISYEKCNGYFGRGAYAHTPALLMHIHMFFRAIEGLKRCVPMGVTTIMDMHQRLERSWC